MLKKKTRNPLLLSYVLLFILFATRLWGLYSYTGIQLYSETFSILSVTGISVFYAILILGKNHGVIKIYKKSIKYLFELLLLIVFVEIFNTIKINPGQGMAYTLVEALFYISIPLCYFVLSTLVKTKEDFLQMEKIFSLSAVVLSCISVLQRMIYSVIVVFPTEVSAMRNGSPRVFIGGSVVFTIGYLLLVQNFLDKGVSVPNFLGITICFLRVFWAEQQRAFSAIMLLVIILPYIEKKVKNKALRTTLFAFLLLIGLVVMWFGDGIGNMNQVIGNDVSAGARVKSITFFLEKAKTYPIFGMGFIEGTNDVKSSGYKILRDSTGYLAQRSDVGLLGLLNMWGIIGLIWYGLYLEILKGKTELEVTSLRHVILLYSLLTSFTLIVTDIQRVLLVPLFLVLVQSNRWRE